MYEAEITDLINKNLPAHVGDVLRKRLERCDALEKEVAAKMRLNELQAAQIRELEMRNRKDEEIKRDRVALDARIAEQDKKELKFAIDRAVLDALVLANSQRLQDNKELVHAVFANAKYKYMQFEDKTVVIPGSNGSCGWDKQVQDRKTVVTEGSGPLPE